MKIKYLFFFSIFISMNTYSQKSGYYIYKLSYDMFLNFNSYETYACELKYNTTEAHFDYKSKTQSDDDIKQDENNPQKFTYKLVNTSTLFIRTKLIENQIFELVKGVNGKKFQLVEENIPRINWEISDSTKYINNYRCFKANGHFAGRNYIVWFSPDLPNQFGPWKLHGLPGSILEARDLLNEVSFFCKKIETVSEAIKDDTSNLELERITKEEYIKDLKKFIGNFGKNMGTKMGRGVTVTVKTTDIKSIEIYGN